MADEKFETCAECPKIQTCNEIEICLTNTRPADPAQSAPSAREIENKLLKRLGFSFKAINSSLTVCVFKPTKVMSLSQSDGKWDVVYLMDKAWELLLELMADKEAAALRTAQLERELSEALDKTAFSISEDVQQQLSDAIASAEIAFKEGYKEGLKDAPEYAKIKQWTEGREGDVR